VRARSLLVVATVALAAVATHAASQAWGAAVSLRVESAAAPVPLFDGTVETFPHAVDGGDGSGAHPCWGPGGDPTASATGALDDALRGAGISWRGNWNPSFRDFFVDRIGPYASASPDRYWSLTINGRFSAGGCLTRIDDGDAVRFYYGPLFGAPPGAEGTGIPSEPAGEGDPAPAGVGRSARPTRLVAAAAARYLRRSEGLGEEWARLALTLRDGHGAARAAAALLGERLSSRRGDGSIGGDINATALAVLALRRRHPRHANRGAAWLAARQSADGGFGYRPGVAPDVDTTGLATWALAVAGRQVAASHGGAFVRAAQAIDGGFPPLPGGDSNSQSTGLAIVALRVAGIGPRRAIASSGLTPLDYLASRARRDGSIAYGERTSPTPVWSTAQALLGLTTRSKLLALGGRSARED
jgi:Prenyltransferase and squalene oxidase repeat